MCPIGYLMVFFWLHWKHNYENSRQEWLHTWVDIIYLHTTWLSISNLLTLVFFYIWDMTINSFRHVQQIEIHHWHNLVLLPNECKPVTTYFCPAKKKKMFDVLLHKHFVARPLWWLYVDRDTMTFGCFMARCNSSTFDFIRLRFTSFKGFIIRVNITFQHCFVKQKQEKTWVCKFHIPRTFRFRQNILPAKNIANYLYPLQELKWKHV